MTKEQQAMYNSSLKKKWDNKNVLDYAVETAVAEAEQKAEKEKAELKTKAEKEKKEIAIEMARKLIAKGMSIDEIADTTGLSLKEIEAL